MLLYLTLRKMNTQKNFKMLNGQKKVYNMELNNNKYKNFITMIKKSQKQ